MNLLMFENFLIVLQTSKLPNFEETVLKDEKIEDNLSITSLPLLAIKRLKDKNIIDERSKLFQFGKFSTETEDSLSLSNFLSDVDLSQDDSESLSFDSSFDHNVFDYDLDSIYFDNKTISSIQDNILKMISSVNEIENDGLKNKNNQPPNDFLQQIDDEMKSEPGCSTQFNTPNTIGFGVQLDNIPFEEDINNLPKSHEELPSQEVEIFSTVAINDAFTTDFTDDDKGVSERNRDNFELHDETNEPGTSKKRYMCSFLRCFSD